MRVLQTTSHETSDAASKVIGSSSITFTMCAETVMITSEVPGDPTSATRMTAEI